MLGFRKHRARRVQIRESRPDSTRHWWRKLSSRDGLISLGIAALFWITATCIVTLREDVVRYRPDQYSPQDILSRVDFTFFDKNLLLQLQRTQRQQTPRVYKAVGRDPWPTITQDLLALPSRLADVTLDTAPADLRKSLQLDSGALTKFKLCAEPRGYESYKLRVGQFMDGLTRALAPRDRPGGFVLLPHAQRLEDLEKFISIPSAGQIRTNSATFSLADPEFVRILQREAEVFDSPLPGKIAAFVQASLRPNHELDEAATAEAQNLAARAVPESSAQVAYRANQILVQRGRISPREWEILRAEQSAFVASLGPRAWKAKVALAGVVLLATFAMAVYIARYQPRILRNHARAAAIALLLLSMLLLGALAAIGTGPLHVFGVAPTILVAMILVIAYDQRFAQGISTMHALLVTVALDQGIGFFLILWSGVLSCCYLLNEVRTRSKLIEVGGLTALAMAAATAVSGGLSYDPLAVIWKNSLSVGAAGLGAGFIALGILPFIERIFRITTSMSLLELADASHPLLRRLQVESPGTYSHSLLVAALAEAGAEAIGANSLLCRVGAYYHDIGKVNKADYFCENQIEGRNRHLNLTPNVSLLIIVGHVKDGVEMAKEYALPTVLIPFIQQHHGTTLVEYFYHQACNQQRDPLDNGQLAPVSDAQYRYPGPRPRTREVAIVMLCDAVESATRAMVEPNASRIETLVHDLAMRRLEDGQFDECPMTFRDLQQVEKALVKTLLGIYHGRMTYPSTAAVTDAATPPAIKSA